MNKRAFKQTAKLLAAAGVEPASSSYDWNAFGSWFIDVQTSPPHRVVWDGKDGWLIVQRQTTEVFNGQPVWEDIWVEQDQAKQTPDNVVEALMLTIA